MSGESRIDVGSITQSAIKGSAMESALAKVQTDMTPPNPSATDPKKSKKEE